MVTLVLVASGVNPAFVTIAKPETELHQVQAHCITITVRHGQAYTHVVRRVGVSSLASRLPCLPAGRFRTEAISPFAVSILSKGEGGNFGGADGAWLYVHVLTEI